MKRSRRFLAVTAPSVLLLVLSDRFGAVRVRTTCERRHGVRSVPGNWLTFGYPGLMRDPTSLA